MPLLAELARPVAPFTTNMPVLADLHTPKLKITTQETNEPSSDHCKGSSKNKSKIQNPMRVA